MDLEDFIWNRTDGSPQDIFKKIADIAAIYVRVTDTTTIRHSSVAVKLCDDVFGCPVGLTLRVVQEMCSQSIFEKAARYEVSCSSIISTQCFPAKNTILGEFRAT